MTTALQKTIEKSHLDHEVAACVAASTESICKELLLKENLNPSMLVVGRVQSGKTLSFTCLIAKLADEGCRLVFVLGGTKDILATQTYLRLKQTLDERRFTVTYNSDLIPEATFRPVQPCPFFTPRTHVVVLLKNSSRINKISKLLENYSRENLKRVLIIDDEADAAGLNTRIRDGDISPTYRAITRLRKNLPKHMYVQYTATPQANLLIPLLDHLSPDSVHVLQPGQGYIGGDTLFDYPNVSCIVSTSDLTAAGEGICPDMLRQALMEYVVGFASWCKRENPYFKVRSMLVHPSQRIDSHLKFEQFIHAMLGHWDALSNSEDEVDDLKSEILVAIKNLEISFPDLAVTPEEIIKHFTALRNEISIRVINSERDIDIDWSTSRGWILVGGANLDRGFTIPGLAVTYMPRGAGQGNVDTLQQRGRFFGYIEKLLPECRIYLDQDVLNRYKEIAIHEKNVHLWLGNAAKSGRNVREIRREYILHSSLQPTRIDVMDPAVVLRTQSEWLIHSTAPRHIELSTKNQLIINNFIKTNLLIKHDINESGLSNFQKHNGFLEIPLQLFFNMLQEIALGDPDESHNWCSALALINSALNSDLQQSLMASIVIMRPNATPKREVISGCINDLLQGKGETNQYPGDRAFVFGDVTIQLHIVDLYGKDEKNNSFEHKNILVLALRMTKKLLHRVVVLNNSN